MKPCIMRYATNKAAAFAYVFIVAFALVALCGCDNNEYYRTNPATAEKSEEVFNPANIEYGTLIDSRDGQKYRTVKIGDRWWLAKNLNYAADSSYCYNDEPDSCAIYGRLYPWTVAMQLDTIYNKLNVTYTETIKGAHQGICPDGWHIPSEEEWNEMIDYADSHNGNEGASASLRAKYSWIPDEEYEIKYIDRFGFAGLAAGARAEKEMREFDCGYHTGYNDNIYCGIGNEAFFWTSTELTDYRNSSEHALYFFLHGLENGSFRTSDWGEFTKRAALSVRCVK